jgi:DNA-binding beta-propeller fold protein YncE
VRFRDNDELWVVNQLSDSINRIDVDRGVVTASLSTGDEPADLIYAGDPQHMYVSISASNQLQVFDPESLKLLESVALQLEEPRALALSPDGAHVYVAAFESGNRSTILAGSVVDPLISFPPNAVSDPEGPYQGRNPPPNAGEQFKPALRKGLPEPPATSLIVQQHADGRWLDDNAGDWTELVSGKLAARSGRVPGWTLLDHDIARLSIADGSLSYVGGLMNVNMALTMRSDGVLSVVGSDAHNVRRFEPNLRNDFVDFLAVQLAPDDTLQHHNLNPQLPAVLTTATSAVRSLGFADPRAVLFVDTLKRGFAVGQGSNSLIELDWSGQRRNPKRQLRLPAGPTALVWHPQAQRLYVYSRFSPALSVINPKTLRQLHSVALDDPMPPRLRAGQALLFDSQAGSATGHLACASCHAEKCADWHPMKGPMLTQSLFDVVGKEPHHWRGERSGLDAFAHTFVALQGLPKAPDAQQIAALREYLAALRLPPNPFRDVHNRLPQELDLAAITGLGTDWSGAPLGKGDAQRGLKLFTIEARAEPFRCASCHTLPSGAGSNRVTSSGGKPLPASASGDQHLGISSLTGLSQVSLRIPALTQLYDRIGFQTKVTPSLNGFGFGHDGSMPTLPEFLRFRRFDLALVADQQDVLALMLAFSGGDLDYPQVRSPLLLPAGPDSRSTPAAAGLQWLGQLSADGPPAALVLRDLARSAGLRLQISQGAITAQWSSEASAWLGADRAPQQWDEFANADLPVLLMLLP